MTDYEMLRAVFQRQMVDKYPQYGPYLSGKVQVRIVQAKRDYKGGRPGNYWYQKSDLMLAFGPTRTEKVYNRDTRQFDITMDYMTVYSASYDGMVGAPANHLTVIEDVTPLTIAFESERAL